MILIESLPHLKPYLLPNSTVPLPLYPFLPSSVSFWTPIKKWSSTCSKITVFHWDGKFQAISFLIGKLTGKYSEDFESMAVDGSDSDSDEVSTG